MPRYQQSVCIKWSSDNVCTEIAQWYLGIAFLETYSRFIKQFSILKDKSEDACHHHEIGNKGTSLSFVIHAILLCWYERWKHKSVL